MAGFQNNPLTKFPLNLSPRGSAQTAPPGRAPPILVHTPVGPVQHGTPTHTQLTPLPARTKSFTDRAIGLPPSVRLPPVKK